MAELVSQAAAIVEHDECRERFSEQSSSLVPEQRRGGEVRLDDRPVGVECE
jgi:hypothetical protein